MTLGTNLLLALLWAAVIGPFTPANMMVGFVVGYAAMRACSSRVDRPVYVRRIVAAVVLLFYTAWEIVLANLRVAWYTVSPLRPLRPAVLRVPIQSGMTDGEITLLSGLITLTPGTLTLDVSPDRSALYVHYMHVDDVDAAIESIKHGFERRVLEMTR
ncbi:MAG: Na+/H+ antiporter subunit E [Phycisphaerales bacterium]